MITGIKRSVVCGLFTGLFLLMAQLALASETGPNKEDAKADDPTQFALTSETDPTEEALTSEEDVEADDAAVIIKITSPTTRNPLPADILDRMRKELMVLMGVAPEESAEPAKKTSH